MSKFAIIFRKFFNSVTLAEKLQITAKKGFTLAEILITLGIIGIIAAMTIPSLMTKIRTAQTEAILKEDFSILNQMMLRANDNGGIGAPLSINNYAYVKNWFNMYFVPYIKTTSVCYGTEHSECWYNKSGCGGATISFTLPNGSSVCMDDYEQTIFSVFGVNTTLSYIYIIDTNGKKLPNKMGEDLFIAVFNTDKASLVPSGDDMSEEEVKKNCSLSGNRYWCLSLMKRNGWKIPRIK